MKRLVLLRLFKDQLDILCKMNTSFYIIVGPYPAFLPNLLFMEDVLLQSTLDATFETRYDSGGQLISLTTPKLWVKKRRKGVFKFQENQKSEMKL